MRKRKNKNFISGARTHSKKRGENRKAKRVGGNIKK